MGEGERPTAGATALQLVDGLVFLRPEEQVFEAMLTGWERQQSARNLAASTIVNRGKRVRGFVEHVNAFPWQWSAAMVDEWCADLRGIKGVSRSSLRTYQQALRLFCHYLTDPAYGWAGECERRFGTHPVQVCHEWNTAVHVQDNESEPAKRAFTLDEIQAFFDYADDAVPRVRDSGRKGWLAAFRDATLFKVAYAFGLRRTETRMLDTADLAPNPHAREFGEYGVLHVRFGKAKPGSPPKRRSVLTVWDWSAEVLEEWVTEIRPRMAHSTGPALWPSEQSARISGAALNARFATYRDALGLEPGLDFHSLRRSYVTHLIEAGWDPFFVQQQVGHEHASTTSIYTCVSSDFRTRTLRRSLDDTLASALTSTTDGGSAR
ncbi:MULTISPECIES: tyrosine-type recombinase/integrase [Saccharothrix]|uniref:tyrosine-type recombinase/integrase n=1 Tax=Saccharothrix TaxID=2071 RepID=UPI00093A2398|nr:site-specific integrase [Saccharothrix sp. CB00851]OKI21379.1 integrase [Saccharothrix sp. CB00851]